MKVLFLTKYDLMGASSRLRTYQYLPYLAQSGIEGEVVPFFPDRYLQRLYSGRGDLQSVLWAFVRRATALLAAKKYDLVWLEKEAFPWAPYLLERLFLGQVPYAVDYDDAVYHRYDQHRNGVVRGLLATKIDKIMSAAAMVTAGNEYLAEKARSAGARRVEIVPTVVDMSRYPVAQPRLREPFTIGWIGSPSTRKYLESVRPALAALCGGGRGRVVLVGAGVVDWPEIPVESRPWSEATEVKEISRFDVGIMPLVDAPWERGKCGYKLIQYMACGVPVVGSPVGVNRKLIVEGVNGFQASAGDEWIGALTRLREDPEGARAMGRAGREMVEEFYSLQASAPRVADLVIQALRGAR